MKYFINAGDVQRFVAPTGGVVSGGVYQVGQAVCVACATVAETLVFEGKIRGIFKVTKVGSQAWTEGALVYWDKENTRFTTTASGSRLAGWAVLGAGSAMPGSGAGETTGYVYLDGTARADEA
jgi:predicted RecA/RadA family phage recombinase